MLSQQEQALLSAVIDRIIPADAFPSATGFGADAYIRKMLEADAAPVRELIRYGLDELARQGFLSKSATDQDRLLDAA